MMTDLELKYYKMKEANVGHLKGIRRLQKELKYTKERLREASVQPLYRQTALVNARAVEILGKAYGEIAVNKALRDARSELAGKPPKGLEDASSLHKLFEVPND